jgi:transposase
VQYGWDRHDRLSATNFLTLSPRRRRVGLYFGLQQRNVCAEDLVSNVRQLHRHVGAPLILVWDRSGPHRKAERLLSAKGPRWLQIEWLPPYAPDLNPTEQCWNQARNTDLANFLPNDVRKLTRSVRKSFLRQRSNQTLLRSYFKTARLRI